MTDDLPKHVEFWLSEARHDCFFMVGPELGPIERIGAMKTLLMGYSEPFRAMLGDSELAEHGDVRLIDVEPETFRNFLKCVYGGSDTILPKLSFEESIKLLHITNKYLVEDLNAKTLAHVYQIWSPDKIFLALSHPLCLNKIILHSEMCDTFEVGFLEISRDKEFLNLSVVAIRWMLKRDVNVKEVEIWNAVLKWAKHQTNTNDGEVLRSLIFPLLKYIRFLAMDYKDLCENVVTSGILLKEEIDKIILSYSTKNVPKIAHLCKSKAHRYATPLESENIVSTSLETPNGVVILCTVSNIRSLNTISWWLSEPVSLAGFVWQVKLRKAMSNDVVHLSIYLVCNNYLRGWPRPVEHTCNANFTFTLMNQSGQADYNRATTHKFCPEVQDWGWRHFHEWDSLIEPKEGFIKDEKLIVSTRIHLVD